LEIDGRLVSPKEMIGLDQVRVRQALSLPTRCELGFILLGPESSPVADQLTPGTALRVTVQGTSAPLFYGRVTSLEYAYGPAGDNAIHVRAYDALHALGKRRSIRTHLQVAPEDLAQELVSDLGLDVDSARAGLVRRRVLQRGESDLEALVAVAAQQGLYLFVDQDRLQLLTLEGQGEPLPLALGASLIEARFEASGEPATRAVRATSWNPLRLETADERVSDPTMGRQVDAEVAPDRVGGDGEYVLPHHVAEDARLTEALAQTELDRRVAYEVTFWGLAEGDVRLRPGRRVDVQDVAPRFRGRYVLTQVTHTLDSIRGFVSELSTSPPPALEMDAGAAIAPAVVTRVDDPDNLGRVRVTLPTYDDLETDWIAVLMLGAGEDKGLMMLPDVGDDVLVLYTHGDPDQSIVLGGLYGLNGAPDSGVEGSRVQRYTLLTPGGQRITLDDGEGRVRIEIAEGSYVDLAPDGVHMHAAADLEIEAPGRSVVIRGQSIDFQRG
jgi:phage baseplate assembly protein V